MARTVTTKLRYPDFAIRTRSTSLPAGTDDGERIGELACALLDRALHDRPGPLRLVGVGVSGLAEHAQLELLWRRLMERADYSRIAHAGMEIMNPIPAEKLDAAIEALGSAEGERAIDLGCGKGDLLGRLSGRYAGGVGVDLSAELLAEARARAPGFEFVEADATAFETSGRFGLAASVGGPVLSRSSRRWSSRAGTSSGATGYWRQPPTPEYLEALGATEDDMADYAGTIRAGVELGLTPLYATTASVDDFDRYEWTWSLNGERYAAAHPDEPGVDAFIAWIRNGRRRYVELGGRETLGFGLFVFGAI